VPPTRVVNLRLDKYDVLIDRTTKWGNPYGHKSYPGVKHLVGSRVIAVQYYAEWIKTQPELMAALPELRGKVLGCHCRPLACHGEVLAALANALPEEP
jgi:hypothetical protein